MTISDYKNNYLMYENMEIWEVKSMDNFLAMDENLLEIFEKEYNFPFSEIKNPANKFNDSLAVVVGKLLDHFGDKHFFVFSNNDANHNELKELQDKKAINFGIDIHVIHPTSAFVLEMDKTKDLKKYDTI